MFITLSMKFWGTLLCSNRRTNTFHHRSPPGSQSYATTLFAITALCLCFLEHLLQPANILWIYILIYFFPGFPTRMPTW